MTKNTAIRVLKSIGLENFYANSTVRFSLSSENTVEEIDFIIKATKEIINKLK